MNDNQSKLTINKLNIILEKFEQLSNNISNISISADSVNLNTDELEEKLNEVNSQLTDLINETHLVDLDIEDVKTKLDTLNSKEFSTSSKQDIGNNSLSSIEDKLNVLNSKNFATENTTNLIKINTNNLDLALSILRDNLKGLADKDFSTLQTELTLKLNENTFTNRINTLGIKNEANSTPVVLASDQPAIPVNKGNNSNNISILASSSSALLVTADSQRLEAIILNNSNKRMWIKYGTTASIGEGIYLDSGEILIEDIYRGQIYSIWETGVSGTAEIITIS